MNRPRYIPDKPSLREIEQANAVMHRVLTTPRQSRLISQGTAPGGWRWWIGVSPFEDGVYHVSADRPGCQGLAEEFATVAECEAWVARLLP